MNQSTGTTTPTHSASEVENLTGVPATTLRQWERRYGVPNPQRTPNGYRLYSQADLNCINFIKEKTKQGIPVSRAVQLYALEQSIVAPQTNPSNVVVAPAKPRNAMVGELVDALLAPNHDQANQILADIHATSTVEHVLLQVIEPTLIEIGDRWHRAEISAAHEHQASNYLRGKLHALLEMGASPRVGPNAVVACIVGEYHELGALILAVSLRRAGVRTHYLGANTPVADLFSYCREVKAAAVLLSCTNPEALEALRPYAPLIRELAPIVIFGGNAIAANPALAQELGGQFLGEHIGDVIERLLEKLEAQQ